MLTERGIPFVAFDIVERPDMRDFLKTLLPNPTTPQVFRDGTRIGGRDDLREYFRAADLCERF